MELKDISTEDLIRELNSRNLFDELEEDKKQWLKENNFFQSEWAFIKLFSFEKNSRCPLYSFEYIKNTPLDDIRSRYKQLF